MCLGVFFENPWKRPDASVEYLCCNRKAQAASTQNFALLAQATIEITRHNHLIIACSHQTQSVFLCAHSFRGELRTAAQCQRSGCNNISAFLTTAPIARSLCEGCTRHNLHILVTAPFCCDRKSQAVSAQSFALWQQATRDHASRSLWLLLVRAMHI